MERDVLQMRSSSIRQDRPARKNWVTNTHLFGNGSRTRDQKCVGGCGTGFLDTRTSAPKPAAFPRRTACRARRRIAFSPNGCGNSATGRRRSATAAACSPNRAAGSLYVGRGRDLRGHGRPLHRSPVHRGSVERLRRRPASGESEELRTRNVAHPPLTMGLAVQPAVVWISPGCQDSTTADY